jgi:hypothetical protein
LLRGVHRLLAGEDGPGRRALPVGELLHPVPLAAAALLVLNDRWLKGADLLPAAVTGKLSDLAGLLFFPLLLTAGADLVLLAAARLGARVDFSLRRWKLSAAVALTAAAFAAVKLSPAAADAAANLLGALGLPSRIVADPTDLVALPVLALAGWLGVREIARVPLGRLEVLQRAGRDPAPGLADVAACGAPRVQVAALAAALADYFAGGDAAPAEAALRSIRAPTAAPAVPPPAPPSGRTRTARPTAG